MFADVVAVSGSGNQTNLYGTAYQQAAKGSGFGDNTGPTDFKYTIRGTNSGANLRKTGATGNGSPHSHNHNFGLTNNQDASSNLALSYPTIGSSDKLYQSTKLRALIKF